MKVTIRKGFAKGEGYDTLRNVNIVTGSPPNDVVGSNYSTLTISDRSEILEGKEGNDLIKALGGPDLLNGGYGADTHFGADNVNNNDYVYANFGRDTSTADTDDTVESCES